jgi:hypothetical protein
MVMTIERSNSEKRWWWRYKGVAGRREIRGNNMKELEKRGKEGGREGV